MDFLSYHKLQDTSLLSYVINNMEWNFEDLIACRTWSPSETAMRGVRRIRSYIASNIACKIHHFTRMIFFTFFRGEQANETLAVETAARSKMHRLELDFPYYQI